MPAAACVGGRKRPWTDRAAARARIRRTRLRFAGRARLFAGASLGRDLQQLAPRASALDEAEVRHPRTDAFEHVTFGRHQLRGRPRLVAGHLADRLERAHHVNVGAEDDEDLTVDVGRLRRGEESDDVGDVPRVPLVEDAFLGFHAAAAEEGLGHAGAGARGDRVRRHAVAAQLAGFDPGERGDAGLGGGVVGLPGVAEEARLRRGVDDPPGHFLTGLGPVPPVDRCVVRGGEVTLEVHADDVVPVGLVHVERHLVPEDAGVVHEDVERAERVDGLFHHVLAALPRADVVTVDYGVATVLPDEVDHLLGRVDIGAALAVQARTDVVDDDLCALLCEDERLFAADAAPCAGDDCNLAVEQSHGDASSAALCLYLPSWCGEAVLPIAPVRGKTWPGTRPSRARSMWPSRGAPGPGRR